jgi:glycerophosphoryl diester phosphodiesterase
LAEVTRCRTEHGERVPALADFLAQVSAKSSTIRFLEDLKPVVITDLQLARLVQIDVSHSIVAGRLRFSSPSVDILTRLEHLAPVANKALLVHRGTTLPKAADVPSSVVDTVLVHVQSLDQRLSKEPKYVSTMRAAGFGVAVWGAKSLSRMEELVRLQVEEIITKRADVFEEWRTS